jgi:hypothetical protein
VNSKIKVDAVIAGAQKCATTSLAAALGSHPDVCLSRGKEAHLFDRRDVQKSGPSQDDLAMYFGHRLPHQLLLDATPSYIYLPGCIESLLRHNPDARVIVVVRHPADRAVSQYFHERSHGFEHRPLSLALMVERFRLARDQDPLELNSAHRHFSYVDRGRFEVQLARLSSLTSNVIIVNFHELISSPSTVINEIFRFLGLSPLSAPTLPTLNIGAQRAGPVGRWIAHVMTRKLWPLARLDPPSTTA